MHQSSRSKDRKRTLRPLRLVLLCVLLNLLLPSVSRADAPSLDLTDLKIEDLMALTVTSAGRKDQTIYDAAAAVFIITQDDIRRSGATSIPEALRMVPGLEVAQIDGNKWAVSSRGFNGRFASKMLVLIDGRTVYTPLFSGVLWDSQDTLLEDVARIEVIRGPGATLWGANAVNGIINIITKDSADTVGGLATAGGGTSERAFAGARYGGELGKNATARLYFKYLDRAGLENPQTGEEEHNGWRALRGGFRLDATPNSRDSFTVQGDYYRERLNETYLDLPQGGDRFAYTTPVSGGNLLGRWKRSFSERADLALQLYYDRSEMKYAVIDAAIDTADLDFQNRFAIGEGQEILWGAGYRFTHDRLGFPLQSFSLEKGSEDNSLFSAFVQGTFTLVPERLHLVVGSKFEHNDYTGWEVQPNARLLWTPAEKESAWLSVSRAVRTPSRGEETLSLTMAGPSVPVPGFPQPLTSVVDARGSTSLGAEELLAFEAGYRVEPVPVVSLDAAAFYNVYRGLSMQQAGDPILLLSPAPSLVIPTQLGNHGSAETCGVEVAGDLKALPWWRLRLAYTLLEVLRQANDPGTLFGDVQKENPRHQLSLRSGMDLGRHVETDLWLRYVDALPAFHISGYVTLDARVAWKPRKDLQLVLVGQNLLHDRQQEFVPQFISTEPAAVGRGVYGKVLWEF